MPKPDVWLPLYVSDYLADTTRLTLDQHGAYLLLIMDYWRNGAPPDDDKVLARIIRSRPAVWRRLRPVLAPLFRVADGRWHHKRINAELAKATTRAEKAEQKARQAAEGRWARERERKAFIPAPSNATGMLQAMPEAMLATCPSPNANSKEAGPSGPLDAVWREGIALLMQAGDQERSARTFVGMLLADYTPEDVLEALRAAHGKVDPKGYVRGVLRQKPKKGAERELKVAAA